MARTYGACYPVSATSRDLILRHADTRPFACTHAWNTDSCAWSCRQQRHLTFPKGLVILRNYAITPPKQRWTAFRSRTDLLFPQKKKKKNMDAAAVDLHMLHGNYPTDPKKRQKITISIGVNHSITPLLQHSSMSPTFWAGVLTCSHTRTSAKVTRRRRPALPDVAKPLFPLFLCFQIFLRPTFMSSSPALRGTRDKD